MCTTRNGGKRVIKVVKAAGIGLLGAAVVAGALAFGIVGASAGDNADIDSLNILVATQDNDADGAILGVGGTASAGDVSAAVVQIIDQSIDSDASGASADSCDEDAGNICTNDADQWGLAKAYGGDADAEGVDDSGVYIDQSNDQDVEQVSVNQAVGDADNSGDVEASGEDD